MQQSPEEVCKLRQQRACAQLREAGFDKAIIGNPMSILYLTGVHIIPYERFYGLVLGAADGTVDMVNPSVDTRCMKGRIPEHTYVDEIGPMPALRELLDPGESVAVETDYYTMERGFMFDGLGVQVSRIGDCLEKLRMHKDATELDTIRFAEHIVGDALDYVTARIKPGMTEKELYHMLYDRMLTFPGFCEDEVIILVLAGENSANCHGSSGENQVHEGDVVMFDFCAYYRYYWSDVTRCFFVGEPAHPELEKVYEVVRQANEAAIAAVRPGVNASSIDQVARDFITRAGYGEQFLHRTGHGLGLSVHEEPYITSSNDLVLEEGMTFTIEPGIYLEGIGGIRLEDNVAVTSDGCEVLTRHIPKTLEHAHLKLAE